MDHDIRAERRERQKLHPAQEESLRRLNEQIQRRVTLDMLLLIKIPAFLRYVGRWAEYCGVQGAISGNVSNNVFNREGQRFVGELMVAELKEVSFDAKIESEYAMHRDKEIRRGILGKGEKFDVAQFTLEQEAFDKHVKS